MTTPDRDDEIAREIRTHLELEAEERVADGLTPDAARAAAARAFGNTTRVHEDVRAIWRRVWLDDLRRDLAHACRSLLRQPGFFATAVLVLALAIGTNAAVYQLFDAIRLRPLPVEAPEQLAIIEVAGSRLGDIRRTTAYPVFSNPLWSAFREHQTIFDSVFAWANADFRVGARGARVNARGLFVSGGFFDGLGVRPLFGRVIAEHDDRNGCAAAAAVLSHVFWQRQFGGDRGVIGRAITINTHQVTIVGVTPPAFTGVDVGRGFDLAVPICAHDALGSERGWLQDDGIWWLTVMGRRPAGRSLDTINDQLLALSAPLLTASRLDAQVANQNGQPLRLSATPGVTGVSAFRNRYSDPLLLLLGATGLVLLVAGTNLATLILARSSARTREFAVRLALGASRLRLLRQLTVEYVVLAAAGASVGLALTAALTSLIVSFFDGALSLDLAISVRLIAFVVTASLGICSLFGLLPAWRLSRVQSLAALKSSGRSQGDGPGASRLRHALVISQLALSVILLFAALLFAGTLRRLLDVDPGFEARGVDVVRVDFSLLQIPAEARAAFKGELLAQLRRTPGVTGAAEVRHVPFGGTGTTLDVWRMDAGPRVDVPVRLNAVSAGYVDTMRMTQLAGRDFDDGGSRTSTRVAIVNQAFARRLNFPGNPVGQTFRTTTDDGSNAIVEIIGLVADTKHFSLREATLAQVFVPVAQNADPRQVADLVVRSTGVDMPTLQQVIAGASPLLVADVSALEDSIARGLLRERLLTTLSSMLAALAVIIAAVGLYGIVSLLVARRTNEMGIRIALGATRTDIASIVLRQAAVLVAGGLTLGAALAVAVAGLTRSLVFGLEPRDPVTLAEACALLAAVALLASVLPARRAARLDPVETLRHQ